MTGSAELGLDADALERALQGAFGDGHVTVASIERFKPWFVARCTLDPAELGTVVVKWPRQNEIDWRTDSARILRERAALEFVAEHAPGTATRVIACDEEAAVLVLEDLTPRVPLWQLLRDGAPLGHTGLLAFATVMAELHAKTAARAASTEFGDRSSSRRHIVGGSWQWTVPELPIDLPVTAAVEEDMQRLRVALLEPGPFEAFSNGDSGANNFLFGPVDGRLIDFESGGFRHCLLDAQTLYAPGPMWMTVADPVTLGIESAYRTVLAEAIPLAADDAAFGLGIGAAAIAAVLERLERFDRIDTRPEGHESQRQIIATLESSVRCAEQHHALPSLRGWCSDVAQAMRKRWPSANVEFPDAYTTRV